MMAELTRTTSLLVAESIQFLEIYPLQQHNSACCRESARCRRKHFSMQLSAQPKCSQ